ncbi:RNA-binding protein pop5 [Tilletia horrida]|uniref:RNA-binding protein pop5 n=1 Tax=Tilletia horrida TaxID=155126 RepID=A0AAN6JZ78_9BASI|nr:RNA-binding protein pop5 [Tilletia horrida]KAK0563377.1 RNA-binding protein pop5 [Tilletia horrida]
MVRFKHTFSFPAPTPPPTDLTAVDVLKLIRNSLHANFGDLGSGVHGSNVQCRYYSPALRIAIIRCARESAKHVWAAVTLITECKGRSVRPRVIHLGGTIKKVQLKAIGLDKAAISNLQTIMNEPDSLSADGVIPGIPATAATATATADTAALGFEMPQSFLDDEEEDAGSPVSLGEIVPRDEVTNI